MKRLAPTAARPTTRRARRGLLLLAAAGLASASVLAAGTGCSRDETHKPMATKYDSLKARSDLPGFLKGTIWEKTQRENDTTYPVSGYGLVGQLRGTGDSSASVGVRAFMTKELSRRGFGDPLVPGFGQIQPGDVLRDPNYAIVRVDGEIPPGARKHDFIDARISCLPDNRTSSLAHGVLFETDLKLAGARTDNPGGSVNVFAKAKGPVLVNPSYALADPVTAPGAAKSSLRTGTVMAGGSRAGCRVENDRPLLLRLRVPSRQMARAIETRILERFQNDVIGDIPPAAAYDEGYVSVYVPKKYKGDWERFLGVVEHLYLESAPGYNAAKAKQLVEEAQRPNAPLQDITLCWEGLGKDSLPFILPLLTHPQADVAFAAARAAAYIGDNTGAAEARLVQMAKGEDHPFAVPAVQVLGNLPPSSALNHMLRDLLDSDQATIRIEAYKILAKNEDPAVYTKIVAPYGDPGNQKFALDIVPSDGPPLIYATRHGMPRIAVIGRTPELLAPLMYRALNNRFTISTSPTGRVVTMFYRDESQAHEKEADRPVSPPVKVFSQPDVPELLARLGGAGERGEQSLNFTYAEVLAIVQELADSGKFVVHDGVRAQLAAFVLQDPPRVEGILNNAPIIDAGGPSADAAPAPRGNDAPAGYNGGLDARRSSASATPPPPDPMSNGSSPGSSSSSSIPIPDFGSAPAGPRKAPAGVSLK